MALFCELMKHIWWATITAKKVFWCCVNYLEIFIILSFTCGSLWLLPVYVAGIPLSFNVQPWSFIKLMVGVDTMVISPLMKGSSWKQRLFPDPVGWITTVSLPSKHAEIIFSCHLLIASMPKYFMAIPNMCAWS